MPAPYTLTELHGRRLGLSLVNRVLAQGRWSDVTMTAATNGTNATKVTFQLVDHENVAVAAVRSFLVTLSDDATNGAGLTATTASGAVTCTTGADLGQPTAKKSIIVQTNSSGVAVLSITDTAKTAFTVVANIIPDHLSLLTLATANYG